MEYFWLPTIYSFIGYNIPAGFGKDPGLHALRFYFPLIIPKYFLLFCVLLTACNSIISTNLIFKYPPRVCHSSHFFPPLFFFFKRGFLNGLLLRMGIGCVRFSGTGNKRRNVDYKQAPRKRVGGFYKLPL